ncbi:hypothetical protein [Paludisphaera rhizosphaerae]|uniref:hypothetical protein n=1 Tax=Paludisphaera rhizosphaerae TaxID=2711216 RepID=UPI0013E99FB7|nr:hypothetical protein [Paludisphaera rhizosphaerae]
MDGPNRKLVVALCMHRSGSSLTTNILEKLGMALGPFPLVDAAPSNPYGHFESIPFHSLCRRVQEWAFGFADDVPDDPAILARFVETNGAWPTDLELPQEWLDEGEEITRQLIASGPIAGFKDPRAVLVWPFWRQVFARIEDVEIVAASLLRSPHEIAMSLCTRSRGDIPYWAALDAVGVHLQHMQAAHDELGTASHVVRFGTGHFWDDMKRLAQACGLDWDDEKVRRVYDPTCVHHKSAVVAHRSQTILNELGDDAWTEYEPGPNAERLAADSRKYEATMHSQLSAARRELGKAIVACKEAPKSAEAAGTRSHEDSAKAIEVRRELIVTKAALAEAEKAFSISMTSLKESEKHLYRVSESLVTTRARLVQSEQAVAEAHQRLAEAHDREIRLLAQVEQAQQGSKADVEAERKRTGAERSRAEAVQLRLDSMEEAAARRERQLARSLEREEKRWLENLALRRRLEKFESNSIIGAAVKGRQQIKQIWLKLRHIGPNGEPRSARVDRPL